MIEILAVVVLALLFWLFVKKRNNTKDSSADEKGNDFPKRQESSIVGESHFVLGDARKKQVKVSEPVPDSSGKMDIEVPLDYDTEDTNLQEEKEELESLGLQNDYSTNITFDEMMLVVNEVGNKQAETTPQTAKLLYENENTDWVEQLSSSSDKNASRISSLIDLHLGKLEQPNLHVVVNDGFMGFDIGEYVR